MINLERATTDRTVRWPSLIGLLLVPLLLAAGFLWTTWGSADRFGRVDAAVVNLDEPAEINGQPVPLGRQLSGGLVEGDPDKEDQNFTWHLSDEEDAASGLESGRYAAVVTIPEDFSTRATSYSGDAAAAEQATLQVETSEITGIADSAVSRTIAETATKSLNTQLTEGYLDNIYLGFNDMGEQFQSVADGASELADGASQLSTGTKGAATGTKEFATGIKELSTGTSELATGTSELSTGTSELSTGTDQLATGLEQLSAGTSTLPKDTKSLATGAGQLSGGVKELSTGAGQLSTGASQLSNGVSEYADGVDQYATGVGTFADGMGTYRDGMAALSQTGLPECPEEVAAGGPQACVLFQEGVKAGAQAAVVGLDGDGTEANPGLVAGAQGLEQGATQLSSGAGELSSGADELSTGANGLSGGAKELSTGASQLSSGLGQLADGMPALTNGISESASGAREIATGTSELATGASQLSTGASQLATGTKEAATGASELSSGMTELSTGARELSQGTTQLSDGLAQGAEEIPSYDEQERSQLSSVVAAPVTTDVEAAGGVGDPEEEQSLISQVASTSLLLVLALWVGGLATFLVVQAVSARTVIDNRSSFRLALAGLAPAAAISVVQAVALTTLLTVILELSVAKTAGVLGFSLLAGLTFVALNHALVAWFGGVGRFVSVIIGVLTAAGSVVSAVPALFDTVSPFLPTTPALVGVRSVITDGSGTAGSVGLLVAWLVGATLASVLAVARKRQLDSAGFVRALAA
ncbi:MAG: YhgE/Pip family protein [Propionibacteriaceae bacterium]